MESASGKSGIDDGTEEKLVTPEDRQNEASKDKNEVKYTASEIQNGETKMDCDMRRAFVGMGKEELMKFANDPFWVLTRQFLFILFWVMWFGMLVGSIAIVVYSPKCTSSKRPWYKDSLVYKFDIRAFEHGSMRNRIGDLKALNNHLSYFEYLGVDSILVNSLIECSSLDCSAARDFKKIDSSFGSFEILKVLSRKMKKSNLHLLMSFDPNHSSDKHEWFSNSIAQIGPFTDYYVWAQGSYSSDDNSHLPPNNWRSITGGSAWSYVKERDQFYLHQFSSHQPDLNFREQKVVDYFKEVLQFWLDMGLSGIHIDNAKYFVEDNNLVNETINPVPGANHVDYDFYSHSRTTYHPLTFSILSQWAEAVEKQGNVLSVSDFNPQDLNSHLITYHTMKLGNFINATEFNHSISANLARKNPTWMWQCRDDCPDEETAKALTSVFILLPGIAVIQGGEELPWPSSTKPWTSEVVNGSLENDFDYFLKSIKEEKENPLSYLSNFTKLVVLRKQDTFKYGSIQHNVFNSTVFAFTRVLSDQGFLVAFNFDDSERSVYFDYFKDISNDTELLLISSSKQLPENTTDDKLKPFITLSGKTLIVLSFPVAIATTSS